MNLKKNNQCNHFWKLNDLMNEFKCELCNDINKDKNFIFISNTKIFIVEKLKELSEKKHDGKEKNYF